MVLPTAGFALHQNQYEIGSCSSLYLMVVLLLISTPTAGLGLQNLL